MVVPAGEGHTRGPFQNTPHLRTSGANKAASAINAPPLFFWSLPAAASCFHSLIQQIFVKYLISRARLHKPTQICNQHKYVTRNDEQGSEGQRSSTVGAHSEHASLGCVVRGGPPEDKTSD